MLPVVSVGVRALFQKADWWALILFNIITKLPLSNSFCCSKST